jgi:hypothetical protein
VVEQEQSERQGSPELWITYGEFDVPNSHLAT